MRAVHGIALNTTWNNQDQTVFVAALLLMHTQYWELVCKKNMEFEYMQEGSFHSLFFNTSLMLALATHAICFNNTDKFFMLSSC